jgi:hypothetical protein
MSVITDIWRQLVRRRLWPLALLLVAALVAVPMVLAKQPEVTTEVPVANGAGSVATDPVTLAADPIVSAAEANDRGEKAKVLGTKHDIFKPTAKKVKVKQAQTDTGSGTGTAPTPSNSGGGSGSSGGTPTGGGATPTPVTEPKPAPKTYALYSLSVRFGASDGGSQPSKMTLPRLKALPSDADALLIYLGLARDHKTAVFMLDSNVKPQGDGECDPTPENCETIRLRVGETEFFDVMSDDGVTVAGQYQLDLLKIHKSVTANAAKAAKSARLARVSKAATLKGSARSGLGGTEQVRRLGVVGRIG